MRTCLCAQLVLVLMPHYLTTPCCSNPEHAPTRSDNGYCGNVLLSGMLRLRRSIRYFLFWSRIRNPRVALQLQAEGGPWIWRQGTVGQDRFPLSRESGPQHWVCKQCPPLNTSKNGERGRTNEPLRTHKLSSPRAQLTPNGFSWRRKVSLTYT